MEQTLNPAVTRLLAADALSAREASYCPYSGFAVGAAVLCEGGRIFTGCNVESAAYSPSLCAERAAIAKAVSEGFRVFKAVAVAGGPAGETPKKFCPPCGVCRQVLREFCNESLPVILVKTADEVELTSLGALFPDGFAPEDLT
ncbi:MAG: cytidine deaminase [Oscillospiraceae bacterium]|nr:cytidine deaminase [Oscillospiraceae bacterium]